MKVPQEQEMLKAQQNFSRAIKCVPFVCVFCLSRLAVRNINISNDSITKCSGMSDSLSGKIVEGKSVMLGTKLGCFTKHSSALG
jgi:hypothetical protein